VTTFYPDLAERSVPRYTSFPTAAEFTPDVRAAQQGLALFGVPSGSPVSLYVHVPYCHQICWYCGCNTGPTGRGDRLTNYRDALLAEIATVGMLMRGRVEAVHFGGGSPNALPPADFATIAEALRFAFDIADNAEWAVELDPRDFNRSYADTLAAAGVTRASLGAQTFSHRVQQAINRVQPFQRVATCAADLRAAGIGAVNLDLMYGLPQQTCDDLAATVSRAISLGPARVAMFGYAHLPAMLPRQRMIDSRDLPGPETRFRQSELAYDLLVAAGYRAIGFDHFAQPDDPLAVAEASGRLRRNFQGFTADQATTVVGLGASAISHFDGLIVQNEKHVGKYRDRVAAGGLAGVRGARRDSEARARAAVIERILCDGTVDVAAECQAHGVAPRRLADAFPRIDGLERREIVDRAGWRVAVRAGARPYRRVVAAAFDPRIAMPGEAAHAV
jgi:oxygen-independent coproporphyrinogen-3 oxidase